MNTWKQLIRNLRYERASLVRGRTQRLNKPKMYKLYEAYIEALGVLLAELELYSAHYTPADYAAQKGLKLSTPARWTDFVDKEDKDAYRTAQEKYSVNRKGEFIKPKKEFFPDVDRLPRGTRKRETMRKRRADLRAELNEVAQLSADHLKAEPDSTFAQFRAQQIPIAYAYLAELDANPMANVPKNWLELLPPADRPSPHDDVVRTLAFVPRPDPTPPKPSKPRGRPVGVKETHPRVRRKMTDAERVKYRSKREALRSYREQCAIKYGE